ncbi:patatin-like phospholipase family protein [Candidatus Pacearchaeota archaeon]|nr:patatin-like phospholipase family protein [Candidatus Pacearchaeota archaeon]
MKRSGKSKNKKGITLVLSGGSARGLAHIGVIEVLQENKIPIKRIIGTSAGALIGGLYSAGKLKEVKNMCLDLHKKEVKKLLHFHPSKQSIFNVEEFDKLLKQYTEGINIESLNTPFIAVAFNLNKGEKYLFEKGGLFDAIRASVSIPGFFKPFKKGEIMLVDGGVSDIVPVDVAKKYKDKIVVVNVEHPPKLNIKKEIENINILKLIDYTTTFGLSELAKLEEKGADVIIHPYTKVKRFDFYKANEIIKEGRKSALKALPKIKKLLREKNK